MKLCTSPKAASWGRQQHRFRRRDLGQAVERIQHAAYENASDHAKHLELEAYSLAEQAGAGISAAIDHCSEAA